MFSACRKAEPKSIEPLPLVRAHTVAAAPATPLALRGTVVASHRVRLGFKLGGVIGWLGVEEGQRVKRGQVVARLDGTAVRASLRSAQAGRDKAKRDADRSDTLLNEGALPRTHRDDARTGLEVADASLAAARDALKSMNLVSPVAGTVFARLAEPGETVGPGMPVLAIDSTERLSVRLGVTESELGQIAPGLAVTLRLGRGTSVGGRIDRVARTPNNEDGLFSVTILPDDDAQSHLLSGALVDVVFAEKSQRPIIRISLDSLVHRQDQDYVFVLDSSSDGHKARQRPVVIEQISNTEAVVGQGLAIGERIVAEGAYFLQDGQGVRVQK
jgi:membrane fusion protein (multidrug efflux system)